MRTPAAAAELATAALARLDPAARARAALPNRIASGADLIPSEVATVRAFWSDPGRPDDPAWVLAAGLLGGRPLARAAAATEEQAAGEPDPGPHTGAMLALALPPAIAEGFALPDGLPADDLHVTLAYLGPADELDPLALIEADAVAAELAAATPAPVLEFTHVAHMGADPDVVAVALEAFTPATHVLRRALVTALTAAGVEWSDRWAFRPHMTITYLPRADAERDWPAGPLPEHVSVAPAGLLRSFAQDRVVYPFADRTGPAAVAASAAPPGFPLLTEVLERLNADLGALDDTLTAEVRTAVALGYRSALDRVGRMATRQASAEAADSLRALDPAIAAVTAAGELTASLNVPALVGPAVADVVRFTLAATARAQVDAAELIGAAFGVEFDEDPFAGMADAAVAVLEAALRAELDYRLGVTSLPRIDPADPADPLEAPFQLTRDALAVAGGAVVLDGAPVRDGAGRPVDATGRPGADGVGLGPAAVALIREAIGVYLYAEPEPDPRGPFLAAARRPAGIRISDALRAELADAAARLEPAAPAPLEQVTVHVWKLNMNGRAAVNLPAHVKLAGTTITTEPELFAEAGAAADITEWPYVGHRYPGDHPHCHCGWKTEVRLVPAQGTLAFGPPGEEPPPAPDSVPPPGPGA